MATGIVNLYTVMSPPAPSRRTVVPQGSSVLWGSGPLRWCHPFRSSLCAFVRTRSDRRFFPVLGWGALGFLIPAGFRAFAMGSPLRVERRAWAWSNRRLSWTFDSKFLRDGVTLAGWVCVSLYVLDRNKGFNLVFSLCHVPSRWGHPFRVEYSYCLHPWSDRRYFLGEPTWRLVCLGNMFFLWLVWRRVLLSLSFLPSLCVCTHLGLLPGCYALAWLDAWHTTVDCLLLASSAAALCVHGVLTFSPLVIHPLFVWQQRSLAFILSLSLQFALVVLKLLWFSSNTGFRAFAMGSPSLVEPACLLTYSIGSKAYLWTSYRRSFAMGHLRVEFCTVVHAIVSKDLYFFF